MLPHWLRSLFSASSAPPSATTSSATPTSSSSPTHPNKPSKLPSPSASFASPSVPSVDSSSPSASPSVPSVDSSSPSASPSVPSVDSSPKQPLVYFGGAAADLMKPPPPPPQEVYLVVYLQGIVCGRAVEHEALTIFPLIRRDPTPADILLLQDAISQNKASIEEINAKGQPTQLTVHNRSPQPILILDSEIFRGNKQARVANASYLLAPQSSHTIEVSPIEQERRIRIEQTEQTERELQAGIGILAAVARAQKVQSVSRSFRRERSFASDLHNLRKDIGRYLTQTQAASPSHSFLDAQQADASTIQRYLDAFPYQEHQVGQIVYLHGHLLALDLLESAEAAALYYPHWIASYAQETHVPPTSPHKTPQGEALLEALWQFTAEARPSLSMGLDLRLQNTGLIGAGIAHQHRLLHLSLFPAKSKE